MQVALVGKISVWNVLLERHSCVQCPCPGSNSVLVNIVPAARCHAHSAALESLQANKMVAVHNLLLHTRIRELHTFNIVRMRAFFVCKVYARHRITAA